MSQPKWATQARKNQLVRLAMRYRGTCQQGHHLCPEVEHYKRTFTKTEITSHPANVVDLREGRIAIPYYIHGMGPVETFHTLKRGPRILPKRVPVQHEVLQDRYETTEDAVIDAWKAEDREARRQYREMWSSQAPTGETGRFGGFHHPVRRGQYDPVDIDNYVQNRPAYKIVGYGTNDKLGRFAKVVIPGTGIILHVDISNTIQMVSQNKRKWLRRQGTPALGIKAQCEAAVKEWWAS